MSDAPLRVEWTESGPQSGVATVRLGAPDRPVTVMDRSLLQRLDSALDEVGDSPAGFVLASESERVFVAGADLKEIQGLSDSDLDEYIAFGQRVLGRIAALRCCTVAAINGAALGGGLEAALHCDVLMGLEPSDPAKPYRVGLPETSLGLCPGWGGTNTLPARIDPGKAIELAASGRTPTVHEARELRLLDDLFSDSEGLLAAARKRASEEKPARPAGHEAEPPNLAYPEVAARTGPALESVRPGLPESDAARAVIEAVSAGLERGWSAALEVERRSLVRLRSTDAAQQALQAFLERGKSK